MRATRLTAGGFHVSRSSNHARYRTLDALLFTGLLLAGTQLEANPLLAWGDDSNGQTTVPPGLTNVVAISAMGSRSLALGADGTVAAWGYNPSGLPVPPGLTNVVGIACGGEHHLALRADGTVIGWGHDYVGQTNVPAGLNHVAAIAAGFYHNLALRADGTVVAWGDNSSEQAAAPVGLGDVVAIAAGATHSLALRSDGTVVAWGDMTPWGPNTYRRITVPSGLSNVVAVAGGWDHDLALRADGTVVAWGDNRHGETNVPPGLTEVVAISASGYQSVALRRDGTAVAWGQIYHSQQWLPAIVPEGLSNLVAIAAGGSHILALLGRGPPSVPVRLTDREVARECGPVFFHAPAVGAWPLGYQWRHDGTNLPGANGPWLSLTQVTPDQAGRYSVVADNALGAVTNAGAGLEVLPVFVVQHPRDVVTFLGGTARFEVQGYGLDPLDYQWRFEGQHLEGQTNATLTLGSLRSTQAGEYSVEVRNRFGTRSSRSAQLAVNNAVAWGAGSPGTRPGVNPQPHYGQSTLPPGLTHVVEVAGGPSHSLALRDDGTVIGWGANGSGQAAAPVGLRDVVQIACGDLSSLALRSDGTVASWGYSTAPAGLSNLVAVAAGWRHSLGLRSDGRVIAWGSNLEGQTNVPPGLSNVVAIAGGGQHSLALRADGTLAAWGLDGYSQTTIPPGLSNVVAIASGYSHNLALRSDGTVRGWGNSQLGQTSVPWTLSNAVAIAAGGGHSMVLKSDGTVQVYGTSSVGVRIIPPGLSNVTAIACGFSHNLAVIGVGAPALLQPALDRQVTAEVGTVFFQAQAAGAWPLCYQWQHRGVDIPNATNSWLRLTQVQPHQAGEYTLKVTNAEGSATSAVSRLAVVPALITRDPQAQSVLVGRTATLDVRVQADEPVHYQWRRNGEELAGETNAALVLPAVDWSDDGLYSVAVSNRFGGIVSPEAHLTVSRIAAWGYNYDGQTNVPSGLSNVVAIAAGIQHSLALRSDGTVVAWGDGQSGQTNVPAAATNVIAIASGARHCLALRLDGHLLAWGYNWDYEATVPTGLSNLTAIAAGWHHNLAVTMDRKVTAWGYGGYGQTLVPRDLNEVAAVAAGAGHSLALRTDGTVVGWGHNGNGETQVPDGLNEVMAIAGGGIHSLALRVDGTVAAWGAENFGATRVPACATNVVAIAAGAYHSAALTADGRLLLWGDGGRGQRRMLPDLTNVVAIAAGLYHNLAAVGPPVPLMLTVSSPSTEAPSYRQTGLLWHVVRLFNTSVFGFPATRVTVQGLPPGAAVHNATGINVLGQPYIQYNQPLAPGASIDLTIEYHAPNRAVPNVTLVGEVVEPAPPLSPSGTPQDIARSLRLDDGSYLIDFRTLPGRAYFVQYSADLATWKTAFPPVTGSGSTLQWVDNGPPKTESHPASQTNRFYRVLLLQ